MRAFKLKVFPLSALEDTVYFLQRCAELFQNCHEIKIKQAFCEIFTDLMSPLGAIVTAETNMPQWIKFVDMIYGKIIKMIVKPKYFNVTLPLVTVLMSISKRETFHQRFPTLLETCMQKLKDKTQRQMAFNTISLIVWIYLFKHQDSMTVTCQKLGAISRQLFPPSRKYIFPPNESTFDNFVDIIRYSGIKFIDFSLTNQIFNLFNLEPTITLENIYYERCIVAVKAVNRLSIDFDKNTTVPTFPIWYLIQSPTTKELLEKESELDYGPLSAATFKRTNLKSQFEKIELLYGRLLSALTAVFDDVLWIAMRHIPDSFPNRQHIIELAKCILDGIPRIFPIMPSITHFAKALVKFALSADPGLAQSGTLALLRSIKYYPQYGIDIVRELCDSINSVGDRNTEILERSLRLLETASSVLLDRFNTKEEEEKESAKSDTRSVKSNLSVSSRRSYTESDTTSSTKKTDTVSSRLSAVPEGLNPAVLCELFDLLLLKCVLYACSIRSPIRKIVSQLALLCARCLPLGSPNSQLLECLFLSDAETFRSSLSLLSNSFIDNIIAMFDQLARLNKPLVETVLRDMKIREYHDVMTKPTTIPEDQLNQWTIYGAAIIYCLTLFEAPNGGVPKERTNTAESAPAVLLSSSQTSTSMFSSVNSAASFASQPPLSDPNSMIQSWIPLVSCEREIIRLSVITLFKNTHDSFFPKLMRILDRPVQSVIDDLMKAKSSKRFQRVIEKKSFTFLFSEIIGKLSYDSNYENRDLIRQILKFIKGIYDFLLDSANQMEWEFVMIRVFFCDLVRNYIEATIDLPDNTKFISNKVRIALFLAFESWSGHGEFQSLHREKEAHMISSILDQIKDIKERGTTASLLEEQRKMLETAALICMSTLCKAISVSTDLPSISRRASQGFTDHSFIESSVTTMLASSEKVGTNNVEFLKILRWTSSIFNSPNEGLYKYGQTAIINLLTYHRSRYYLNTLLDICYSKDTNLKIGKNYLSCIVRYLENESSKTGAQNEFPLSFSACLVFFMFAVKNFTDKEPAVTLLRVIRQKFNAGLLEALTFIPLGNMNFVPYLLGSWEKFILSSPEKSDNLCHELMKKIDLVRHPDYFLHLIGCCMRNVVLAVEASFTIESFLMLHNMLYLTLKYFEEYQEAVSTCWINLARFEFNVPVICSFLIQLGILKSNHRLMHFSKKIIGQLCKANARVLFESLMYFLQPDLPTSGHGGSYEGLFDSLKRYQETLEAQSADETDMAASGSVFVADLGKILVDVQRESIPPSHFAFSLIADVAIDYQESLVKHLPNLLHFILLVCDSKATGTTECCDLALSALHPELSHLELGKTWKTQSPHLQPGSLVQHQYDNVDYIVQSCMNLLTPIYSNLRSEWGRVAFYWATKLPNTLIGSRSWVIFKTIDHCYSPDMLYPLIKLFLDHLSNMLLNDPTSFEYHLQYLLTLKSLALNLKIDETSLVFIFLMAIALMKSLKVVVYLLALEILEILFDRQFFSSVSVLPGAFRPLIDSIPDLLLKGITCKGTFETSYRAFVKLLTGGFLNDRPDALLLSVLMLSIKLSLSGGAENSKSAEIDQLLQFIAENAARQEKTEIAKLFLSFARGKFRVIEDFVQQLGQVIQKHFYPSESVKIALFYTSLLRNPMLSGNALNILRWLLTPACIEIMEEMPNFKDLLVNPLIHAMKGEYSNYAREIMQILLRSIRDPAKGQLGNMAPVPLEREIVSNFSAALFSSEGLVENIEQIASFAKQRRFEIFYSNPQLLQREVHEFQYFAGILDDPTSLLEQLDRFAEALRKKVREVSDTHIISQYSYEKREQEPFAFQELLDRLETASEELDAESVDVVKSAETLLGTSMFPSITASRSNFLVDDTGSLGSGIISSITHTPTRSLSSLSRMEGEDESKVVLFIKLRDRDSQSIIQLLEFVSVEMDITPQSVSTHFGPKWLELSLPVMKMSVDLPRVCNMVAKMGTQSFIDSSFKPTINLCKKFLTIGVLDILVPYVPRN